MACNCFGAKDAEITRLRADLIHLMPALMEIAQALGIPDAEPAAVVAAAKKSNETWRCFHCGFETADAAEAEAHFGDRDDAQEFTPTCSWWSKLSAEERAQEFQDLRQQLNEEQFECGNLVQKNEGLQYRVDSHESEISSRFKGCTSVNEAWNQYHSMEGRAMVGDLLRKGVMDAFGLTEPVEFESIIAAAQEVARDTERLNWMEGQRKDCAWRHKSWICRGGSPELVCAKIGENYPEGKTQPSLRAALDASERAR